MENNELNSPGYEIPDEMKGVSLSRPLTRSITGDVAHPFGH